MSRCEYVLIDGNGCEMLRCSKKAIYVIIDKNYQVSFYCSKHTEVEYPFHRAKKIKDIDL